MLEYLNRTRHFTEFISEIREWNRDIEIAVGEGAHRVRRISDWRCDPAIESKSGDQRESGHAHETTNANPIGRRDCGLSGGAAFNNERTLRILNFVDQPTQAVHIGFAGASCFHRSRFLDRLGIPRERDNFFGNIIAPTQCTVVQSRKPRLLRRVIGRKFLHLRKAAFVILDAIVIRRKEIVLA